MTSLIFATFFRGINSFITKLALGHGHSAYIALITTIVWLGFVVVYAAMQLKEHPFQIGLNGYLFGGLAGIAAGASTIYGYQAMKALPITMVSIFLTASVVVTAVCAYFFLGEQLSVRKLISGAGIIICAIIFITTGK